MSSELKLRRGSTAAHSTFTGADGEVTLDTDKNVVVSHDGITLGGFPHTKAVDLAASSGASLVGYLPAGTGAVATTVQTQLRSIQSQMGSVKDAPFLAGSGGDDTAKIQAADTALDAVYFPPGTYSATALTMTKPWIMADGAEIVFAGTTGQVLVTCSGSNITGNLNLSGDDLSPRALLLLTGSNNRLSTVRITKIKSPLGSGTNTGVDIEGNDNTIESVIASDVTNTGNVNDSMPQALVASSTSTRNTVGSFVLNSGACALCHASTGTLTVGDVQIIGAADNGLYALSGYLDISTFSYSGSDEPIVSSGASLSIGTVIVSKAGNAAIGVQNSGDIRVGTLILKDDGITQILKTRTGNTASGKVFIGNVIGEFTGNTLISCNVGTVDYLSIPVMDVKYNWGPATSGTPSQWCRLEGCKGYNIGPWNIRVIDTTAATMTGTFELVAGAVTKVSFVQGLNIGLYQSDEVTTIGALRMSGFLNALVRHVGLRWQVNVGPYAKEVGYGEPQSSPTVPTIGTWRVGERLFRNPPVVGQPKSWVCTVAGTPGTWVSEGNL